MACLFFFALFSVTQTDSTAPVPPKQQFPVSLCWLLAELGSCATSPASSRAVVQFFLRESKATWKKMDIAAF